MKWFVAVCLLPLIWSFQSCGIYSQSGASIPADAKTFRVEYIQNNATLVSPSLSQVLTEKLKTKFINETPLKLTTAEADLEFKGRITSYIVTPAAITQGTLSTNSINRLTLMVEIEFENRKDPTKNFTQTFSNFTDFDASLNFTTIEQSLIVKLTDGMVQDIFNKAFINW